MFLTWSLNFGVETVAREGSPNPFPLSKIKLLLTNSPGPEYLIEKSTLFLTLVVVTSK
ncbi:Uncharacterised protein [Streptococcus pneumoniae]|nr:Uncharacterised protein [Streptococcus pneumoniae]